MSFRTDTKYYIIAYNCYYESWFKREYEQYGNPIYVFRTRQGDIHLVNNQTFFGTPPIIFSNREDALMELGIRIYRGVGIRRTPFTHKKHIQYVFNKAPEKLI